MYWVRVDRPLKLSILHEEACEYALERRETPFMGINEMKRDGGWFGFDSYLSVKRFFEDRVKVYGIERVKECDICH